MVGSGLDGRTITLGVLAVVLALGLGGWAGTAKGPGAGALAALGALLAPAALAVAVERRARNAVLAARRQEVLRKFAPPQPMGNQEDEA